MRLSRCWDGGLGWTGRETRGAGAGGADWDLVRVWRSEPRRCLQNSRHRSSSTVMSQGIEIASHRAAAVVLVGGATFGGLVANAGPPTAPPPACPVAPPAPATVPICEFGGKPALSAYAGLLCVDVEPPRAFVVGCGPASAPSSPLLSARPLPSSPSLSSTPPPHADGPLSVDTGGCALASDASRLVVMADAYGARTGTRVGWGRSRGEYSSRIGICKTFILGVTMIIVFVGTSIQSAACALTVSTKSNHPSLSRTHPSQTSTARWPRRRCSAFCPPCAS